MNTRLDAIYTAIEKQNTEKFLHNQLKIDSMWGKTIYGATLQVDLHQSIQDKVCEYQKALDDIEPDNLLFLPRQYQHISVNQVVFWGGTYQLGTKETWEHIAENFTSSFKKINNTLPSFCVTFSKRIATTEGIIWCAYDEHDEMETLRNTLLQTLPFPKETSKFNHIIHTTVARYKHTLNNPQNIFNYLQNNNDIISMKIDKIILRKEKIFPSFQTEEIAKIQLQ